jgi:hypothetical protein
MLHHPDPDKKREGRIVLTLLVAMADCAMRFESAMYLDGSRKYLRCATDADGNRSDFKALTVEKGSRGERVAINITAELYDLLRIAGGPLGDAAWLKQYRTGPVSGWKTLVGWCRSRGVPEFEPHGMRRMAAVLRWRKTRNIMAVAELLRDTPAVAWTYLRSERVSVEGAPVSQFGVGTTDVPRLTGVDATSDIARRTVFRRSA